MKDCPNYPYFRFNPDRTTVKRELTDEAREKLRERFKKAKKSKKGDA